MKLEFIEIGKALPFYTRDDAEDVPRLNETVFIQDKFYVVQQIVHQYHSNQLAVNTKKIFVGPGQLAMKMPKH